MYTYGKFVQKLNEQTDGAKVVFSVVFDDEYNSIKSRLEREAGSKGRVVEDPTEDHRIVVEFDTLAKARNFFRKVMKSSSLKDGISLDSSDIVKDQDWNRYLEGKISF